MKFMRVMFSLLLLVMDVKSYFPYRTLPPPSPMEGCANEYNISTCTYNVNCFGRVEGDRNTYHIDNNYGLHYENLAYGDMNGDYWTHECNNFKIMYDNSFYTPIHLKVKVTNPTTDIFDRNQISWYQFIVHLDLSCNDMAVTPELNSEMTHLASYNLSNNQLEVAKLYNTYEIPTLNEIIFSFNTISAIQVDQSENVYRNLKKINLSHNYLMELPDAVFDSFTQLETLDLSHNYIDTLSISTFEGIKKLVSLYLSHNRISDINYAFFRFSELTVLDMSNNRNENIKLHDFEKLTKLETIDFSSNLIISIEKFSLSTLNYLKSINLHNNQLKVMYAETFADASSLFMVDLSDNYFNELPRGIFKGKNIGVFYANGNNLQGSLSRGMFEGLGLVTKLDLSCQHLTAIEDYAFLGLSNLNTLLLNNNQIEFLSNNSLRSLHNLNTLDLSENKITELVFDAKDLVNLRSLELRNNYLTRITHEHFQGLTLLNFLDLSNNHISKFESKSFKSLRDLVNFKVSNNPLQGTLEANTFEGLNSLPSLIIFGTNLTTITNGSFTGMTDLKELNMSHSQINDLQFNAFTQTGGIDILDLSFNQLRTFDVNASDLIDLQVVLLHNNFLAIVTESCFSGLSRLTSINLSHNNITTIHNQAFTEQTDLGELDLSYNSDLVCDVNVILRSKKFNNLRLSGVKNDISFTAIGSLQTAMLERSNSNIANVTKINLKELTLLDNLILSNNEIVTIEVGAFTNISQLRYLDVSRNKITYIQPGVFKDNVRLFSLNVSYNSLTAVSYGIFRGLDYLDTLDMSYNFINSLESERFYEVRSLRKLIVDHNQIHSIDAEDFAGTSLSTLSIGENPLPCEMLVNFRSKPSTFTITAIKLNDHTGENIDGVTCNMNGFSYKNNLNVTKFDENENLLVAIKEQLIKIANKNLSYEQPVQEGEDFLRFSNLSNLIEKIAANYDLGLSILSNSTSKLLKENNNTNILLGKILNSLNRKPVVVTTPFSISKDLKGENVTNDLVLYINKVKEELENAIAAEKENILKEVEERASIFKTQGTSTTYPSNTPPVQDKLLANEELIKNDKSFVFTETCVALILCILICLVLYKFYKSRMFVRVRRSYSTRELPGAMESPNL